MKSDKRNCRIGQITEWFDGGLITEVIWDMDRSVRYDHGTGSCICRGIKSLSNQEEVKISPINSHGSSSGVSITLPNKTAAALFGAQLLSQLSKLEAFVYLEETYRKKEEEIKEAP